MRQQGSMIKADQGETKFGVMFEKKMATRPYSICCNFVEHLLNINNMVQIGILHHLTILPSLNTTRQYLQRINAVNMFRYSKNKTSHPRFLTK